MRKTTCLLLSLLIFATPLFAIKEAIYDAQGVKFRYISIYAGNIYDDDKILDDCSLIADKTCNLLKIILARSRNPFIRIMIRIWLRLRGCDIDDDPDDEPDDEPDDGW